MKKDYYTKVCRRNPGFTLVELAIVLIIIGFLVGGIVVGQNMIRGSQLQAMSKDVEMYKDAARMFQDKYLSLPGDMQNATSTWGAANSNPVVCRTTVGTGTQTCDGTGNGKVAVYAGGLESWEMFRFWQHLGNAGMLEGKYTGVAGSGSSTHIVPGTNVPLLLDRAGAAFFYLGQTSAMADFFDDNYGHIILVGGEYPASIDMGPVLTPEEASLQDKKLDDGLPGRGKIRSVRPSSMVVPNCTTGTTADDTTYNTADSARRCLLIFLTGI